MPDMLVHLPLIIIAWTSLNLSWGIFTGLSIDHIMRFSVRHHGHFRAADQSIHAAVWVCNAMLFLYLYLISGYMTQCADFILVFDIFVTSFFVYVNTIIVRWYNICAHVPPGGVAHQCKLWVAS